MAIRPAIRKATRLSMSIGGYSGSGKTYTALKIARELVGKDALVVLIDTERAGKDNGASELYADRFGHSVLLLEAPFRPKKFVAAITEAVQAGAQAIIIDSVSHEWEGSGGCLEWVDELKSANTRNNGWDVVTPAHTAFLTAIEHCPVHIICCIRAANGVDIEKNDAGRTVISKHPMKLKQRDGFEFITNIHTLVMMDDKRKRRISVEKSRYEEVRENTMHDATSDTFVNELVAALNKGVPATVTVAEPTVQDFLAVLESMGYMPGDGMRKLKGDIPDLGKWSVDRHSEMLSMVSAYAMKDKE